MTRPVPEVSHTGLVRGFCGAVFIIAAALFVGCPDSPPARNVVSEPDSNLVKVNQRIQIPVVASGQQRELRQSDATCRINPNTERSIPVTSPTSGHVVELYVKLGDRVKRGQLLLKILSDEIATVQQNYRQATGDEALAKKQLEKAQLLFQHGAISHKSLQTAEDTEASAALAVDATSRQLGSLGGTDDLGSPLVNISAPASGTIVEQNVFPAGTVHSSDTQPNLFTIADLSLVWALCDISENDLSMVKLGNRVDVRLDAFPDRRFPGKIADIGQLLNPNSRTARVRVAVRNPGLMRLGMPVTITFYGQQGQLYTTVPRDSVLHFQNRDWVFVPAGPARFRRTEITVGKTVGVAQQVLSGLQPGQLVVSNAQALNDVNRP